MLVPRQRQTSGCAAGFTLVELLVFIVVVAVGLTGTVLVINRSVLLAPEALVRTRAMELAQAYLDEIVTKRYDENTGQGGIPSCLCPPTGSTPYCSDTFGPDGTETRATYDDVDDYQTKPSDDRNPHDAQDNAMDNYAGYEVQVSVLYAGSELGLADNCYAKRITVVITTPLGTTIPVSVYRTNY